MAVGRLVCLPLACHDNCAPPGSGSAARQPSFDLISSPCMRVTLVTPVYNQAEFLGATIESVLAQDYSELEYLVIDDGSSDDSLLVAQRYESANPGRLTVLTQANAGQAATLNRGWRLGRGQFLGYLSADDRLHPQAISKLATALQASAHAVMAYCDFELMDAAGRALRKVETEDFDVRRLEVDLVCQPGPGALFRRQVFEKTGGWDASLRQVPDFAFWLRASVYGHFIRVPATLAQYRIHPASATFREMPPVRAEEILRVVQLHWQRREPSTERRRAQASALCIVAKNHAQSGRLMHGLGALGSAFRCSPPTLWRSLPWRQFGLGLLYRCFGVVSVTRRFRRLQG
jgi:GT2 family glycosyltransferase